MSVFSKHHVGPSVSVVVCFWQYEFSVIGKQNVWASVGVAVSFLFSTSVVSQLSFVTVDFKIKVTGMSSWLSIYLSRSL